MPENFYKEALKKGQKEKRHRVSRGQYPYLPVLEDMISKERLNTGIKLSGVIQIPSEFIMGTKTEGRTNAFAANFMPLLEDHTEFADKWKNLCKAHMEEGIRDAVKVYEYMNRYYVEEGNKRVSVLKFFDAVSIPAQVTRILPPQGEEPELKRYYELLEFYKCTKINYIEFSKCGSYEKLQKLMEKAVDEVWTEEEVSKFRANYYYFRQVFASLGGEKLDCTVGDAFLGYINIYGYNSFREKSGAQIKEEIGKIWEELELLQEEDAIDLKLAPEEERKLGFLRKLLSDEKAVTRVAFVYDKSPEESGWIYGHELGRQHVEKVFDGKILTKAYEYAMDAPEEVIEYAIREGNEIIFTTSENLLEAGLSVAVKHPEVLILNCSLNKPHRYIRTYYARMYEIKFISGIIAGILTENASVGYICDYPIAGQIAGINAFARGVGMVNPKAKVYLEWSSEQGIQAALDKLKDRGIKIISSIDLVKPEGGISSFGLYQLDENGKTNLAMPVWHWGVYYEKLIRSMLNKTFQWEYESSSKALNYYWGISAGVIELLYSKNLPESVKQLAEVLKQSISEEICHPLEGYRFEQIIAMDWLEDNVEGRIIE